MINIKKIFSHIIGNIYIPKDILHINDPILLHISDTPTILYGPIKKLIHEINPTYIVHTGDLVDNIKLEFYPSKIDSYSSSLPRLIEILESSKAKEIYIGLGNHDKKEVVQDLCNRSILIDSCSKVNIGGISMNISHYPNKVTLDPGTFNLFGHNVDMKTHKKNGNIFLNGITGINIINLNNLDIHILSYPWGTDDVRMRKSRIGF
ncbi:MAG: metallophosphoesterase [Anaeromicrobium sp.]|jgi:predicted phosphodiesterase|uniref:metallophosphoesterase n=1 Tax=Anaeromicrobium sp. TaxID=1929132 RepID=UPI0025D206FE|nr:metallophosphoesterase [Anaeromicrobium sp.]MCT4593305.1 metallophosphoesterase [Anaeromicrobium sp.]